METQKALNFINQNKPKIKLKTFLFCSSILSGTFMFLNSIMASDRYHNVTLKKSDFKGTGWFTLEDLIKWFLVLLCTIAMIKFAISAGNKMRNSQGWSAFLSLVGIVCCAIALNIFRQA